MILPDGVLPANNFSADGKGLKEKSGRGLWGAYGRLIFGAAFAVARQAAKKSKAIPAFRYF